MKPHLADDSALGGKETVEPHRMPPAEAPLILYAGSPLMQRIDRSISLTSMKWMLRSA